MNTMSLERYETLENVSIKNEVYENVVISGSYLNNVQFQNVTFRNCSFFGSKLNDSQFSGCKFINCKFQFLNIANCNFISSNFINCVWEGTSGKEVLFENSHLDSKTLFFLGRMECFFKNCFSYDKPVHSEKDLMAA